MYELKLIMDVLFVAIFETKDVYLQNETHFGMYTRQEFNVADYEIYSRNNKTRIGPLTYFHR